MFVLYKDNICSAVTNVYVREKTEKSFCKYVCNLNLIIINNHIIPAVTWVKQLSIWYPLLSYSPNIVWPVQNNPFLQ